MNTTQNPLRNQHTVTQSSLTKKTKKTPRTQSDRYISTPPTTRSTSNNNGSQFHSLISSWEDMNAIQIEPNRTIATNQFDPKADFALNELSLAIAQLQDENS